MFCPEKALAGTQADPERIRLVESVRIYERVLDATPSEPQVPFTNSEVDVIMTSISSAYTTMKQY
eukprot:scaffold325905_cov62-Attheya_sp.AAC.1